MTFIGYAQGQNIWKPNNLEIFGGKKTKGFKQTSQHQEHRKKDVNVTPTKGTHVLAFVHKYLSERKS